MPVGTKPGQFARRIPGDDGQRLADLTGVRRDLRRVADACRVIHARKDSPAADAIRRACFDSAVMRYRRCFRNAIRELFPTNLREELSGEELQLHERVLEIADRSVAHCVDGSEENWTYVRVGPKVEKRVPLEINVFSRTVSHQNVINAEAFEALAHKLERRLEQECVVLSEQLLEQITPMRGKDVLAWPECESGISDDGEALHQKYRGIAKRR